jgi:hypothetical protein
LKKPLERKSEIYYGRFVSKAAKRITKLSQNKIKGYSEGLKVLWNPVKLFLL